MYFWRPILAKITTLQEVENHWSIDDLTDAHELLDIKGEAEEWYYEQNKPKKS